MSLAASSWYRSSAVFRALAVAGVGERLSQELPGQLVGLVGLRGELEVRDRLGGPAHCHQQASVLEREALHEPRIEALPALVVLEHLTRERLERDERSLGVAVLVLGLGEPEREARVVADVLLEHRDRVGGLAHLHVGLGVRESTRYQRELMSFGCSRRTSRKASPAFRA